MASKLGLEAKLYRNTGTYATPVWNEITNVRDLSLSLTKAEADVSTRATGGWRAQRGALKEGPLEFGMVWDTEDEDFDEIRDSFLLGTAIPMAVMDGAITASGTEGLRAAYEVFGFTRNENLEEAITVDVSMKITYSANPPVWMEVA